MSRADRGRADFSYRPGALGSSPLKGDRLSSVETRLRARSTLCVLLPLNPAERDRAHSANSIAARAARHSLSPHSRSSQKLPPVAKSRRAAHGDHLSGEARSEGRG